MNYLTRYYVQFNQMLQFFFKKLKKFKENFLCSLFNLFFGFFIGSLFGTIIDVIRKLHIPDSVLIFILLFFTECVNCIVYRFNKNKSRIKIYHLLNVFKIGILLGFFIDSFKVGS